MFADRHLRWIAIPSVVGLVCALLAYLQLPLPLEILWHLSVGWLRTLRSSLESITFNAGTAIVALATCLLFVGGLNLLLRRWRRPATDGRRWPLRRTAGLVLGFAFAFIAGLSVVGIAHQLTWLATSREPLLTSGRGGNASSTTINHLKLIGLALHHYHEAHESLPPGAMQSSSGRPVHGWQTLLLPFLDHKPVSDQLDLGLPWDAPANAEVVATPIEWYSSPRLKMAHKRWDRSAESHFAGNIRVLQPGTPLTFAAITDGESQTLIVGEVAAGFKPWGDPTNLRDPALGLHVSPHTFGFSNTESTWFLHADGSVHEYHPDTNPAVLKALATPAGGD